MYKMLTKLKNLFENSVRDERGEVNIIAVVVLIVIALGLLVIFREQITGLINGLFGNMKDDVNKITK